MKHNKLDLMFHVVLGYPSLTKSKQLIAALCERQVDYLEIQVPFSDPMADGPLITMANQVALRQDIGLSDVLDVIAEYSGGHTKLLLMSYFQPVFKAGPEKVIKQFAANGGFGCIVPDLPIDQPEAKLLHSVPVLSPGMTTERISLYKKLKPKLVYCTARQGITGSQSSLNILDYIKNVKRILNCKTLVGFGIQHPNQLDQLPDFVDGAVIGSAVIGAIDDNSGKLDSALRLVDKFIAKRG